MTDPISAMAPSLPMNITEPLPVSPVAPARQTYDGFDAERFSRLMESPRIGTPAPSAVSSAPSPASDGLGDKMLARMSSMGTDFQKSWQNVADVVGGPDKALSMQDMLKAQMHMVKMATEYEVIGKVIGKSTQNIDQMLRMQ